MTTLAVESLGYTAGSSVLIDGVSLTAHPGELLGVVGPNGAGKSTLLQLMAGDRTPTRGSVTLDGRPIAEYRPSELARMRAVLPQQTVVQFPFTSRDIVLMGRHPHHGDPNNSHEHDLGVARAAMAATHTLDLETRIFPSLSGGEQTRVAFARILAQETPIILLDEPTTTLDVHHQEHTMQLLGHRARRGAAIVAVLHDLNLAAAYAGRLVLLSEGRVRAIGSPAQVLDEDVLSETYHQRMRVMNHPHRDCPLVVVE